MDLMLMRTKELYAVIQSTQLILENGKQAYNFRTMNGVEKILTNGSRHLFVRKTGEQKCLVFHNLQLVHTMSYEKFNGRNIYKCPYYNVIRKSNSEKYWGDNGDTIIYFNDDIEFRKNTPVILTNQFKFAFQHPDTKYIYMYDSDRYLYAYNLVAHFYKDLNLQLPSDIYIPFLGGYVDTEGYVYKLDGRTLTKLDDKFTFYPNSLIFNVFGDMYVNTIEKHLVLFRANQPKNLMDASANKISVDFNMTKNSDINWLGRGVFITQEGEEDISYIYTMTNGSTGALADEFTRRIAML